MKYDTKSHIVDVKLTEKQWERVDTYFEGYTHVGVKEIPAKYEPYILPTREIMKNEGKFMLKYGFVDVESVDEHGIIMDGNKVFKGRFVEKAYQDAKQLLLFVTSVVNIDEILAAHPDVMDTFFLEFWAVSVLGVVRDENVEKFRESLLETPYKCTTVWSPGQAKFELTGQKPLFDLLRPEEIGVTLDQHMRMIPLKTTSGTVGIVPKDSKVDMISCDYCEHATTCPAYKGTKFKKYDEQRRLG